MIKFKTDEAFDAAFMEEVDQAIDYTYKSQKHNFGARMKELETHVKSLKNCVVGFKKRKDTLLAHSQHIETKLVSDMQQATKGREEVESSLAELRAALSKEQAEKGQLQMEKTMRVEHLTQQLAQTQESFKQQLDEAKLEVKLLSSVRLELESKAARGEVEIATLKGDLLRANERALLAHATIDQLKEEVRGLGEKLSHRGEELSNALSTFDRNQAFAQERISTLEREKREQELRANADKKDAQARFDKEKLALINQAQQDHADAQQRYDALLQEKSRVEEEKQGLQVALAGKQAALESSQERIGSLERELEAIKKMSNYSKQEQLESLCKLAIEADCLRQQLEGKENLGEMLAKTKQDLGEAVKKLHESENVRRMLHNRIQELKGNVRVMARVRPLIPGMDSDSNNNNNNNNNGGADSQVSVIECSPDAKNVKIKCDAKDHSFTFDQVFPPQAQQEQIFEEVAQLVQSALDGFDVCLFSYGQTGSGKTHTMQGAPNGPQRGIIPRAIQQVLAESARLESSGWKFTLEATFLEIYMENVYDLLSPNRKSLEIKLEDAARTHVPHLSRVLITNAEQIDSLMATATKARSTASTGMNERSSRSHSVFTLHCIGKHAAERVELRGSLNLCDLAGSERVYRSQVEGEELLVTQWINKSLSALALVFSSLAARSGHIPYRNSKLTYLLQHCFSNQGKALMFVNLSPARASAQESLCSLRFAHTVSQTTLGRPTKNIAAITTSNSASLYNAASKIVTNGTTNQGGNSSSSSENDGDFETATAAAEGGSCGTNNNNNNNHNNNNNPAVVEDERNLGNSHSRRQKGGKKHLQEGGTPLAAPSSKRRSVRTNVNMRTSTNTAGASKKK